MRCTARHLQTIIQTAQEIRLDDRYQRPVDLVFYRVQSIRRALVRPYWAVLAAVGAPETTLESVALTLEGLPGEHVIDSPLLPNLVRRLEPCGVPCCHIHSREFDDDNIRCIEHAPRIELQIEELRNDLPEILPVKKSAPSRREKLRML
jgi:hypothetical protein